MYREPSNLTIKQVRKWYGEITTVGASRHYGDLVSRDRYKIDQWAWFYDTDWSSLGTPSATDNNNNGRRDSCARSA